MAHVGETAHDMLECLKTGAAVKTEDLLSLKP